MLRLLGCNTAKKQQGNKVRNGHQGIHAVGNIPNDVKVDDTTEE